ncbi:hypothetical protein BH09MYX1_BH09MYX1_51710 [soil metagenome]
MKPSHLAVAAVLAGSTLLAAKPAKADLVTPLGGHGQLVIQQIAGFRAGGAASPQGSGFSYSGILGFNYSRYSESVAGTTDSSNNYSFTSIWIAPSADFFPIDHLTIGGLIEVSATLNSLDRKVGGATTPVELPTTVNFTVLPRVGWMFAIGDRFAIWPRVGAGYTSKQFAQSGGVGGGTSKVTFAGFVLDVDTTFLFRFNETFFAGLTPELTFVPGSTTVSVGTNSSSVSASALSFSVLGGIGVIL